MRGLVPVIPDPGGCGTGTGALSQSHAGGQNADQGPRRRRRSSVCSTAKGHGAGHADMNPVGREASPNLEVAIDCVYRQG